MVQKRSIKLNNTNFLRRGAEHGGLGACPLEKFLRATPSRMSENSLLKNRIKVAPITDLCEEKEVQTE